MDLTVGKLKIGDPLVMGKYGVLTDEEPQPIIWLKGTPNSDFISLCALDYICFDTNERGAENDDWRYGGNPNYRLSNILSFANSEEELWYHPMHQYDSPPVRRNGHYDYHSHYGFLYYFEDYEIESLVANTSEVDGEMVTTLIRLPSICDITGENRFKLFMKKGIRPKGTSNLVATKYRNGFDESSFVPYWTSNISQRGYCNQTAFISRNGAVDSSSPCNENGFRPVCSINPDTPVSLDESGLYHILPRATKVNVFTDTELFDFLGMAKP